MFNLQREKNLLLYFWILKKLEICELVLEIHLPKIYNEASLCLDEIYHINIDWPKPNEVPVARLRAS